MRFLDERARLFGRLHIVDAIVAACLVLAVAGGFGLRRLFQMPAPELVSLSPNRLEADRPARVRLAGRHLRPFLTARLEPSGSAGDTASGVFLLETPERALMEVAALKPGHYDVALYDQADEIVRLPGALTVEAVTGAVQVSGAFRALSVVESEHVLAAEAGAWGKRLSIGRPARYPDGRITIPADLDLRCSLTSEACRFGGVAIAPQGIVEIPMGGRTLPFEISHFLPKGAQGLVRVLTTVRTRILSSVVPIAQRDAATGTVSTAGGAQIAAVRDVVHTPADPGDVPRSWITVVVRIPTIRDGVGLLHFGDQTLRVGEGFGLDMPRYFVRGVITDIEPVNDPKDARR